VRAALDELGVAYSYVDIHLVAYARLRVREINHGCESVPTLVFPDGSTLTEPSVPGLQQRLALLTASAGRCPSGKPHLIQPRTFAGHQCKDSL
jgi:mycoredoxin